jgi:hypothetical protein
VLSARFSGKMPGTDQCAAQALLAEIGPKATAFTTPEQLASWTRLSRQSEVCRGQLQHPLGDGSSQKIEAKGAVWAVAHRIATVIWIILTREVEYIE